MRTHTAHFILHRPVHQVQRHGRQAIEQALLVRGHRDFDDRPAYEVFVREAVMRRQLLLLQTPGCPAALAIAQLANKIETTLLSPAA